MRSTPSFAPKVVTLPGFTITNLAVTGGQVNLQWKEGVPPFQVIGEPTLFGPWNDVGNPTTARSKVFPQDINHFFTVQGNIVMPLTATQTNNLTRLTWEAPDTAMSDSLQQFTLKRSTDNGATFPTTVAVVQPGQPYSVDDTTAIPPGGSLTWELLEQTLNGVVVPYSKPVASNAAPGTALWAHSYGGIDHDLGYAVSVDGSGNVYGCGRYDGVLSGDFGTGRLPAFGTGSGWVAKYSPNGVPIWSKGFGIGAGVSANCTATPQSVSARNGFVAIAGTFTGTVDFSSTSSIAGASKTAIGAHDIFVALYTDAGVFVWVKTFGTPTLDSFGFKLDCSALGVAIDSGGNALATGSFSGSVNFGDATRVSSNGSSIFALKLSAANGTTVWSKQMGGSTAALQQGAGISIDPSDGTDAAYVTGQFAGTLADFGNGHFLSSTISGATPGADIFVAKYRGADGECVWAFNYGGTDVDEGRAIAAKNGDLFIVGDVKTSGVSVGGPPLSLAGGFVAKYLAADGSHAWSQSFSVGPIIPPGSSVNAVSIDPSGNPIVVGAFGGTMTLPTSTTPISISTSGAGIFVIKFTGAGSGTGGIAVWAKAYHSTGGQFGTGANGYGNGCAVGPDSAPVVIGQFFGSNDALTDFYNMQFDSIPVTSIGKDDVFFVKLAP